MLMTLMGRAYPDLPAELLFSDLEIKLLQAFADTMGGKKNSSSQLNWVTPSVS